MRSARWFFKGRGYESTSRTETDCSASNRVLLEALSPRRTFSSLQCRNDQQIRKVGRYRLPTAHFSNWHPYPPMNNVIVGGKQVVLPPLSMDTGKQT